MEQPIKDFYRRQYNWIRLPHPDPRVITNKKHPLHQIELGISHSIFLVHNVIRAVLKRNGQVAHEEVSRASETFDGIRFALELAENTATTAKYKHFVDETLELLKDAATILG